MFAGAVAVLRCRSTQQVGELLLIQPHQFRNRGFRLRRVRRRMRRRTVHSLWRLKNGNIGLGRFCVRRRHGLQCRIVCGGIGTALATRQQQRRDQRRNRHQASHRAFSNLKFPTAGQSGHSIAAPQPTRFPQPAKLQGNQRNLNFQHDIAPHTLFHFGNTIGCSLQQHIALCAVTLRSQRVLSDAV